MYFFARFARPTWQGIAAKFANLPVLPTNTGDQMLLRTLRKIKTKKWMKGKMETLLRTNDEIGVTADRIEVCDFTMSLEMGFELSNSKELESCEVPSVPCTTHRNMSCAHRRHLRSC